MTTANSAHRKKIIFWSVVIIFFYALAIRLSYVESVKIPNPIASDALKYMEIAYNIVNNGTYSSQADPPYLPDTFITPGYPLFLASIMKIAPDLKSAYVSTQRIQGLLSAITAVIVFLIALELLPLWAAFFAGFLMMISPQAVIMSGFILTETLFTFLLYLAVYAAIKGFRHKSFKWFCYFGIIAGAASLVRPALLFFPFLLAFLIPWHFPVKKRGVAAGCVMLMLFILLQTPWFAWKHANNVKGGISPAATSFALGTYPDLTFKNPKLRGYPYEEDPDYDKMSRSTGEAIQILLQRAQKEPWNYINWYLFEKPVMYWSWDLIVGRGGLFVYYVHSSIYSKYRIAAYSMFLSKWMYPVLLVSACFSILLLLKGFVRRHQNYCSDPGIQIVALLAVYFTAVHTVLAPLPRYSIPVHGCIFLLGTCGFVFIISLARKKSSMLKGSKE